MNNRMNRFQASSGRVAAGLLAMGGAGLAGLVYAQSAGQVAPPATAAVPVLTPYSGPVEVPGQWLQSRDVRARELRSALKSQSPLASEAGPASRRLSAAEREAMRAQLRGQRPDDVPTPLATKAGNL